MQSNQSSTNRYVVISDIDKMSVLLHKLLEGPVCINQIILPPIILIPQGDSIHFVKETDHGNYEYYCLPLRVVQFVFQTVSSDQTVFEAIELLEEALQILKKGSQYIELTQWSFMMSRELIEAKLEMSLDSLIPPK